MKKALLALILAPAPAGAFDLALPLDCVPGESCFIQHYPDHDPGPGRQDFACGTITYDGHDGTDFALPSLAALAAGVTVRAAAPGVVRAARDGMPDVTHGSAGAPDTEGRDCGNGVLIRHADGWETQYCHLKQGSITVRPGDPVALGTPLGQVGLSGRTQFPHLHLTLRRQGRWIDPFAPEAADRCGTPAQDLWAQDLPLSRGGIIGAGFAPDIPAFDRIKAGDVPAPATEAPALVLWAYLYGTQEGDRLTLTLTGPQGAVAAQDLVLERTQAQSFRAIGRQRRDPAWPAGQYHGSAELRRGGEILDRIAVTLTLP